tara:strand:+ start:135 stop:806 length:672 start_codon:yes stop_codon:yes gene_type:complete
MKKYISIIPIRAGSKGLISKNSLLINEKPLYMYTLEQALEHTERTIISTDIESVFLKDFPQNVQILRRDKSLSKDNTPLSDVLTDLFKSFGFGEYIAVLLQATSPLRNDQDIRNAIGMYETNQYSMVMSIVEKDSKILKYGLMKDNIYEPIYDNASVFQNRQELPKVYSPNGAIYIFSIKDYLVNNTYPISNIGAYLMPESRSIDIDTQKDFDIVSKIIMNKN